MILIITGFAEEKTVGYLNALLQARSADPVVIALATLEEYGAFSIANGPHGGESRLRLIDRDIDLREVRSALVWRSWRPDRLTPRFRELETQREEWGFFENEWLAFHKGFTMALAAHGIFCVNPPPFNFAYEEKCSQLWLAAEAGLRIPPTLYATRLASVRAFYEEHDGAIIYKPFRAYMKVTEVPGQERVRAAKLLTNRVRAEDLVESEGILPTPGIFQPYIPKQLELRIVVVGRRLFTCAIHSQESARTKEDWRRYDLANTPHRPYELPDEIAQKILRLIERMGLVFGSVDMILTPEGEYVFLEVNPTGQFDWIAQLTGMPIYEHLAAMLMAGTVDYPVDALDEVAYAR